MVHSCRSHSSKVSVTHNSVTLSRMQLLRSSVPCQHGQDASASLAGAVRARPEDHHFVHCWDWCFWIWCLEVQCRDFTMCFVSSPIRAPILKEKAVLMGLHAVGSPASVGEG